MAERLNDLVPDGTGGNVRVTGELRGAVRSPLFGRRSDVLLGEVFGHEGFADGTTIATSSIVRELPGGVFQTKNGAYRVTSWANAETPDSKET